MSTDDGYWTGYYAGREEAETRDLNFDTLTDERDAARREVAELREQIADALALADEAESIHGDYSVRPHELRAALTPADRA